MFVPYRVRTIIGLVTFMVALGTLTPSMAAAANSPHYVAVPTAQSMVPTLPTTTDIMKQSGDCQATKNAATPNIAPQPHLTTTVTATSSTGTIANNATVIAPKFPFSVTYTITVKNTGSGDMFVPASLGILSYDIISLYQGNTPKETFLSLPKLKAGQAKIYSKKVTYHGGTQAAFVAIADANCQLIEDNSNTVASTNFTLYSQHVDLVALTGGLVPDQGHTHVGDGVNPGEKANAVFYIANFGSTSATSDLNLKITSLEIGGTVPVTIKVAKLPAAGAINSYSIIDPSHKPIVYIIKPATKTTNVPFSFTINTPHTIVEDSYSNETFKGKALIVPTGSNLYSAINVGTNCPDMVGSTLSITITVYNGGTLKVSTPFQVQPLLDGKPYGAPVQVSSIAAGKNVKLTVPFTVAKQGFHTFGAIIDSTKVVNEYNETDNKITSPKYFFILD